MDQAGEQTLVEKLRVLPPEQRLMVTELVDFLLQREADRSLTCTAAKLSEEALRKV